MVTLYLCTLLLQKAVAADCTLREIAELVVRDVHIDRQHLPTPLETAIANALGNHKKTVLADTYQASPPPPPEFYTRIEKELDLMVTRKVSSRSA